MRVCECSPGANKCLRKAVVAYTALPRPDAPSGDHGLQQPWRIIPDSRAHPCRRSWSSVTAGSGRADARRGVEARAELVTASSEPTAASPTPLRYQTTFRSGSTPDDPKKLAHRGRREIATRVAKLAKRPHRRSWSTVLVYRGVAIRGLALRQISGGETIVSSPEGRVYHTAYVLPKLTLARPTRLDSVIVLSPAPMLLALSHPRPSYVQTGRPTALYIRNKCPTANLALSGGGDAAFHAVGNFVCTEFSPSKFPKLGTWQSQECPPGRCAPAPCMLRYFCNVTGRGYDTFFPPPH